MADIEKVKKIKEKYDDLLLRKENVVGVGIGKKTTNKGSQELCIKIYVTKKRPKEQLKEVDILPSELEGVKTEVIETGKIRFLGNKQKSENK